MARTAQARGEKAVQSARKLAELFRNVKDIAQDPQAAVYKKMDYFNVARRQALDLWKEVAGFLDSDSPDLTGTVLVIPLGKNRGTEPFLITQEDFALLSAVGGAINGVIIPLGPGSYNNGVADVTRQAIQAQRSIKDIQN